MKPTTEVPTESVAALVMACIAINDILATGQLTPDTVDELQTIQPHLNNFLETA